MSGNFYKKVIDESPTGYAYHKIICDEKGMPCDFEFMEVNSAFEKMIGLNVYDLVGKRITEILPDIKSNEVDWLRFCRTMALGIGKKELEYHLKSSDKWYRLTVFSLGKNYFVTHALDLSREVELSAELKKIKKTMVETEHKYRIITNYLYSWETWEDESGKLRYVSAACEKISGYKVEEFIENAYLFLSIVLEEDKEIWLNHCYELHTQRTARSERFGIRRKSGEIVSVEHVCRPVITSNGIYCGCRANIRDITEKKKMQAELRKSEEKYREIVENALEGILSINLEQCIIFVNQSMASMLGYTIKEMLGKKITLFMDERQLDDHYEQMKLRRLGKDNVYERCLRQKNGEKRWMLVSAKAVMNSEGKPEGSFAIVTDINKRKQEEEKLKKAKDKAEEENLIKNRLLMVKHQIGQY